MTEAASLKSGARLQKEGEEGAFGIERRLQPGETASGERGRRRGTARAKSKCENVLGAKVKARDYTGGGTQVRGSSQERGVCTGTGTLSTRRVKELNVYSVTKGTER